jgi:hypothetical protein
MDADAKQLKYVVVDSHLWSIAHHEAGHAVMAYILGSQIDSATIVPETKTDDDCVTEGKVTHWTPERSLVDFLFITFAGPIASKWVGHDSECDGDYEKVGERFSEWMELIGCAPVDTPEGNRWIQAIKDSAETLLTGFRPWVEAVARALYERQKLTGDDIKEVIKATQATSIFAEAA